MENFQLESKVLGRYFDPKFQPNIPIPVETANIDNDDPSMLGYAAIKQIQSINIDEISFGKLLIQTSNLVADLVAYSQNIHNDNNFYHRCPIKFSPKDLKCITYIDSLYAIGVFESKAKLVEKNVNSIKRLKTDIQEKLQELKLVVPQISSILTAYSNSDSMQIQMRWELLNKFYTFQVLRIKTIEQHIEASEKTILNASNFLSFTLDNLTYSLQPNLMDIDFPTVRSIYHNSISDKLKNIGSSLEKIKKAVGLIYGPATAFIFYSLVCALTSSVNLVFAVGLTFWITLIAFFLSLVQFSDFDGVDGEERNYGLINIIITLGLLSLLLIVSFDIFAISLKLSANPLISFVLGSILTIGAAILRNTKTRDYSKEFSKLEFRFNQIESQYIRSEFDSQPRNSPDKHEQKRISQRLGFTKFFGEISE